MIRKKVSFFFAVATCLLMFWAKNTRQLNLVVNSLTNITYESGNNTCDLLTSPNVSASIKCLILCQKILCQSLEFDTATNNCSLFYGRPELIEYDSLPGISLTYILSKGQFFV